MMDLALIWTWLRHERTRMVGKIPLPALPEVIARNPQLFDDFVLPARVMLEIDEQHGPMFQLHPNPAEASRRSWAWVVAVRAGAFAQACEGRTACAVGPREPDVARETAAWRGETFNGLNVIIEACMDDFAFMAKYESLAGPQIHDLVLINPGFTRVLGRMLGHATVLGYPQRPEMETQRPVRVFKTLTGWMESLCAGAVLIGPPLETDDWLRGCEVGIITDDVAHGQQLHKRLRRPYDGPSVLVAA